MSPTCTTGGGVGINTALGCLRVDSLGGMLSQILGWAVSVGGGIALMFIIFAGFQIVTSGGDPKKVQAAKELMTSAITGLLLVIFSLVIMNFFGVNILGLGSLGFSSSL
jgi:3-phosphoglycerate kinase